MEEKKQRALTFLDELDSELLILRCRIAKARNELPDIETEDQIDAFIQNNDLEKDLNHVYLHV